MFADGCACLRSGVNHLIQITAAGPKIKYVGTSEVSIKFENGIFYSKKFPTANWLSFTIEEKTYAHSNHSTKISFYCDKEKIKETQSNIQAFINELMGGIKPEPRFSLSRFAH